MLLTQNLLEPNRPGKVRRQIVAECRRSTVCNDSKRIRRLRLDDVLFVPETKVVGLRVRIVSIRCVDGAELLVVLPESIAFTRDAIVPMDDRTPDAFDSQNNSDRDSKDQNER